MPTYVSLIHWTDQGIKNYKDTTTRAADFSKLVESSGGRVRELLWTVGEYDLVTVVDFPDSAQSAVMCSPGGRPALGVMIAGRGAGHNHRPSRNASRRSAGWNRVGADPGSVSRRSTACDGPGDAQPLPLQLGVQSLDPDQRSAFGKTVVQVVVAPALVVLQVSVPVPLIPWNAPVPPVSVNVPLNVAAVALVCCPIRLNVPCVVPVAYQFVYVPSCVTVPVVALRSRCKCPLAHRDRTAPGN